ncbi:glycosyltransferase family 2 protein [Nonlabens marinus]|uniref:Glycosyltransferase n=1 Tax=Nonlabens marinus S1-08 TaxID=1454201 RepID=W8W0P8_9FLAO|nr:glycosyltransferase family 2 protein [Nonlabens marinus]BAO56701.1 glycosyltransferase [Nonlabens marinus S1-08]
MKIGIVILNWNGVELLKKFLPTVLDHSKGHAVYIADNASTDDSVKWVKENHPEVQIHQIPTNLGYAGGYNHVVPLIKEEVLCLLNSDVEVAPGWCEAMEQAFSSDPNLAAAQPKILDYYNKDKFEYAGAAGGFLDQLGYPYCRGRVFDFLEMDHGQYDYRIEVDWASGAALFVRKSVFEDCDGFDEDYFAHQEEIDLCWRMRQLDYSVQVIPGSQVYHIGGGTLNNSNPRKTFLNFRNSLFTVVKNDKRSYWWLLIVGRLILDGLAAVKFLFSLKPAHVMAILKAHFDFYRQFSKVLAIRKKINENNARSAVNQGVKSIVISYYILGHRRLHNE